MADSEPELMTALEGIITRCGNLSQRLQSYGRRLPRGPAVVALVFALGVILMALHNIGNPTAMLAVNVQQHLEQMGLVMNEEGTELGVLDEHGMLTAGGWDRLADDDVLVPALLHLMHDIQNEVFNVMGGIAPAPPLQQLDVGGFQPWQNQSLSPGQLGQRAPFMQQPPSFTPTGSTDIVPVRQQQPHYGTAGEFPRAMGHLQPTPEGLREHQQLEWAARRLLANPHDEQHQHETTGASGRYKFAMPSPSQALNIHEQPKIVLAGSTLAVQQPRIPLQDEWLSWMLKLVLILQAHELGDDSRMTAEAAEFAAVTTSATLVLYVTWICKMSRTYPWTTLFKYDKRNRERLARDGGGSFDPAVLIQDFLTELVAGSIDVKGKQAWLSPVVPSATQKGTCNNFNAEAGCQRVDCRFVHHCSNCGGASHGRATCRKLKKGK